MCRPAAAEAGGGGTCGGRRGGGPRLHLPHPLPVPSPSGSPGRPPPPQGAQASFSLPDAPSFPPPPPLSLPGIFRPSENPWARFSARVSGAVPEALRPQIRARGPAQSWARAHHSGARTPPDTAPFLPGAAGAGAGGHSHPASPWPPWKRMSLSEGEGRPEDVLCIPPPLSQRAFFFFFFSWLRLSSSLTPASEPTLRCGPLFIFEAIGLSFRGWRGGEGGAGGSVGVQGVAVGWLPPRAAVAARARARCARGELSAEPGRVWGNQDRGSQSVIWTQLKNLGVRVVGWGLWN